ncbi:Hypothetical predicted protein [Octopus vulgaris]|uniref:Uncharacterized protein n=1 Tax=Octopus vulgaris TaxID=6645 RepID=A0AA36EZX2_OCTVU|nr:Hypothetical predicted protein [Octopus vulgaris]
MEYKENEKILNAEHSNHLRASSGGLYPTLPTAPPLGEERGYHLQKVPEIQQIPQDESEKQQNLRKKYRAVKVISNVDFALSAVSMGLGVAGAGLLSTFVAAPILIIMELAALGTGQINERMMQKVEKHEKIKMLAEAKLNTIRDFVSKALTGNKVSGEEYTMILSELTKYYQMQEEVRSSTKKVIDNETRESLPKMLIKLMAFMKNKWPVLHRRY